MIYICSNCFSDEIDNREHTETCLHCGSQDIFTVDDLCVNSVINLNKFFIKNNRNIRTLYSCEGHFVNKSYIMIPYILFSINDDNDLNFLYDKLSMLFNHLENYGLTNKIHKYDLLKIDNKVNVVFKPKYKNYTDSRIIYNKWKYELWNLITIITCKF